MNFNTIILIAIGLSMDAFAVSVTLGIHSVKITFKKLFFPAFLFGIFQGLMPIIGWYFGLSFRIYIERFAPILAFILLSIIGLKMIAESKDSFENTNKNYEKFKVLFILAIATSIDALAVGISFSVLNNPIFYPAIIITLTTFIFSVLGIFLGHKLKKIRKDLIEISGGLILISIGIKILLPQIRNIF